MLIPLPGVAATLLFVFGMMGWSGIPIYLTLAVMPVLLTATGVTNDIYLFTRYFTLLRERPSTSHVELIGEAFDKLASPVACTSLATAIGFFSFAFSPLMPVKAFGVVTGVGVLFGLLYSLTAVPALLALIPSRWFTTVPGALANPQSSQQPHELKQSRASLASSFARFGRGVLRYRWWLAGLTAGICALSPLGLARLVVQDSWTDAFDPDSVIRRATRLVNQQFDGMHLLLVTFEDKQSLSVKLGPSAMNSEGLTIPRGLVEHPVLIAGSAVSGRLELGTNRTVATHSNDISSSFASRIETVYGLGNTISSRIPIKDVPTNIVQQIARGGALDTDIAVHTHGRPEVIRELGELTNFLRRQTNYAVGGVLGPADYLATTRFMAHPDAPDARRLPKDPPETRLMWEYYGIARGQQRLHQIVDTNYWQSLTTVFMKDANFQDTARLMSAIRNYDVNHLAKNGIKLGFAGDVAVSQSLISGIVRTQMWSLCISLIGILAVTSMFGRSLRRGFFCVIPSCLAILVKFAIMGRCGIPLGVATSMFAAMTLGIGVNCAIHLLESCKQAIQSGDSSSAALVNSLRQTGPAAAINTAAVSLGFSVLMLSQVPANARLGILVVLGLAICLVASLTLLPILIYWWPLESERQR
jgi:predicted RND superfamily exporter protein